MVFSPVLLGVIASAFAVPLAYPRAKRGDVVDDLHGQPISDPYRWMEDVDSQEVADWIAGENELTEAYLSGVPERDAIRKRLTELINYERFSVPVKAGHRYFFTRNSGLENQSPLYVSESLHAEPRLLLDPNKLSADGTAALNWTSVSEDGRHLAYAVSLAGSDWQVWHVRDVETGEDLSERLEWSKFSGATWTQDGKGFFYGRFDAPASESLKAENYNQKLYYHRIGTDQSQDELIYARADQKEWSFYGEPTEDDQFLIISVVQGTFPERRIFFRPLHDAQAPVVELLPKNDAAYSFLGNDGPVFYFLTDKDAPRRRIIAVDTANPEEANWRTVLPESDATLTSASLFGDQFFAHYLKDSHSVVKIVDVQGESKGEVPLPGIGSVGGLGGKRSSVETFLSFNGYTTPSTIYRYDIEGNRLEVFRKPEVKFRGEDFVTEQAFFASKDGTKIPMFLTYRKGLNRDGSNPTFMTGYGGFNIPTTPRFSPMLALWLDMGGVVAEVVLRGGSDYGRAWYDGGRLANKQNVFDDFIAGAEYLISEGITKPSKLAAMGGSNGGLLMGAVETQRPDLWGAIIPAVGVLDMLRFDKFTIGWAWKSDYGDPAVEADFKNLLSYSPYHNLKPGVAYPPTLVTTGDHDDRVYPAHSFKYAAALQQAQSGENPVLIRVETRAGHGAGKPISKVIAEISDVFAFIVKNLAFNPNLP